MNRWLKLTKTACLLAAAAFLLPAGYEEVREELLERTRAQESIIPDSMIMRRMGIETAISQSSGAGTTGVASPVSGAQTTDTVTSPAGTTAATTDNVRNSGTTATTTDNVRNSGTSTGTATPGTANTTSGTSTNRVYRSGTGTVSSTNTSGSISTGTGTTSTGASTPGTGTTSTNSTSTAGATAGTTASNPTTGITTSKNRVIYSGTSGSGSTAGTGYSPVMTVQAPITGYLGGSKITMLANQTASQMMSVLIETNQGKLIMLDGGTEGDAAHLIESIAARGGKVDTWLITHPHSDHVGALNYILNHPESGITVDNIYCSLRDLEWYQTNEAYRADMVAALMASLSGLPAGIVHNDIYKGQEIYVDNIKIQVMNKPYWVSNNAINNSSVAYKLNINGRTAMFLGDMGYEVGQQFLADTSAADLKSDILQMAHHGQNGVDFPLYKAIAPEVCMWPTPDWLWNNDGGSGTDTGDWLTIQTRQWMAQLGVKYNVCIKDGDQVIQ